jgi:hypothetical protein
MFTESVAVVGDKVAIASTAPKNLALYNNGSMFICLEMQLR